MYLSSQTIGRYDFFDSQPRISFYSIRVIDSARPFIETFAFPLSFQATAIALDQSKLACELTLENAKRLGLSENLRIFRHKLTGKLPAELEDYKFDMIVSNPPYVPSGQMASLEPEIKIYEDLRALDGGPDGLTVVKAILEIAGKHLKSSGVLWLEVDSSHPPLIKKYLEEMDPQVGLKYMSSYKDMFRKERFVEIMKV